MNWKDAQAFLLQLARVGMGGAGVYALLAPSGDKTIGWGLVAMSGVAAGVDVWKVKKDISTALASPPPPQA